MTLTPFLTAIEPLGPIRPAVKAQPFCGLLMVNWVLPAEKTAPGVMVEAAVRLGGVGPGAGVGDGVGDGGGGGGVGPGVGVGPGAGKGVGVCVWFTTT